MNKQINLFCIALVLSAIIFTSCPPPPEAVAVTGVSLSLSEVTLNVNEYITLTATVSPENATNKNVSWSSSDETVATVDTNGLVKALKAGTTTITVKTEDGEKTATCSVTVAPVVVNVTEVSLSQSELTLNVNESVTLTATVSPENASNKNVSWTSSDETVATVDTNGLVKALKEGTATITVKTEDGEKTATCSVTVTSMVKLDLKGKSFQMGAEYSGSNAMEKPVHKVTFTRDIYMCDHEVTQKEWQDVMGSNPSRFSSNPATDEEQENRPVEKINWYMAIAYCNKRSIKEGLTPCYSVKVGETEVDWENLKYADIPTIDNADWNATVCDFSKNGYRLPTEAEWEYAARGGIADTDKLVWAGTTTKSELEKYAWYKDNSDSKTHEVKKKLPNGYGLYDMSGNVWEWCWDRYGSYAASATDPTGAESGSDRIRRGGSWFNPAYYCRASYRHSDDSPTHRDIHLGFRLVRTVR